MSDRPLADRVRERRRLFRFMLFRWCRHWQLDCVLFGRGYFCVGLCWFRGPLRPRFIAYFSPDATPSHPRRRGWTSRRLP